ncbi:hypothetical protein SEUCBS139899_000387 [Sporothrix eucalyptigena]|uniref:C6 finger domain protein n=1 Tax=Sporothrix eucalyptigena TaxID=1812306 RepID=A0ABP0BD65_9PEZI
MRAGEVPRGLASLDLAEDGLHVTNDELVCSIKAEDISIRWMNAYVPTADQTIKVYQPSTIAFLHRSLKAYAGMVVRGRGIPSFIHPAQMNSATSMGTAMMVGSSSSSAALTTCLNLARICDTTLAGSNRATADAVAAVLKREMDRLYAAVQQPRQPGAVVDHFASLAAFQAYLLYALVLFFQLERQADPFLRQAIMALQEIACTSARHGLVCTAEQSSTNVRPRWAAWVLAEAKRRTLYVVYLFDSVLSAHDGLASYVGSELRGLPAPSCKELWRASSLSEWTKAYQLYLDDWSEVGSAAEAGGAGLTIDELWAFPFPEDTAGLARRRQRVDRWLESVDEYGTMMYAVTSSTHGG